MTNEDILFLIENDPDFITSKRFNSSLKELLNRYQDGVVPDRVAASALGLSLEEYETKYQEIISKLKDLMVPKDEQ